MISKSERPLQNNDMLMSLIRWLVRKGSCYLQGWSGKVEKLSFYPVWVSCRQLVTFGADRLSATAFLLTRWCRHNVDILAGSRRRGKNVKNRVTTLTTTLTTTSALNTSRENSKRSRSTIFAPPSFSPSDTSLPVLFVVGRRFGDYAFWQLLLLYH